MSNKEKLHIDQLSYDSLRQILEQMKLEDIVTLKDVSPKFERVVEGILARTKCVHMNWRDGCMSPPTDILTVTGPHLDHLSVFGGLQPELLELIPVCCTSLTELVIRGVDMKPVMSSLEKVCGSLLSLKNLKLIDCSLNDDIEKCLSCIANLSALDLSFNECIIGDCFTKITKLKRFSIEGCENVRDDNIRELVENNKDLEHLNIKFCRNVLGSTMRFIAGNLPDLTSIVCSMPQIYCFDTITEMEKLKRFSGVALKKAPTPLLLTRLAASKSIEVFELEYGPASAMCFYPFFVAANLRDLTLITEDLNDANLSNFSPKQKWIRLSLKYCSNISEKQLLRFITENKLLETLILTECTLTETFLFKVIEILEGRLNAHGEQALEKNSPLKIVLEDVSIDPNIIHDVRLRSKEHLVLFTIIPKSDKQTKRIK